MDINAQQNPNWLGPALVTGSNWLYNGGELCNSPQTPMTESQERRRFSRVTFNAWTEIRQQQHSWQAQLIDLSLKGLLIAQPEKCSMAERSLANATIRLADNAEIRMKVSLVRQQQGQMAFACEGIDVESISHLRRLVELNLGDPHASERELAELMSLNYIDD